MSGNVHRRAACGFTLIEMLTTITVAGILLAIAVPAFKSMTVNSRLTTQANDVIAAINFSRSEAIKRNTTTSLCRAASTVAAKCETSAGTWKFWIVRTAAGSVIRRGTVDTYGNSIALSSPTLVSDQVAFGSDGLARTGGAIMSTERSFAVCAKNLSVNNRRTIKLAAGSRVSTRTESATC